MDNCPTTVKASVISFQTKPARSLVQLRLKPSGLIGKSPLNQEIAFVSQFTSSIIFKSKILQTGSIYPQVALAGKLRPL